MRMPLPFPACAALLLACLLAPHVTPRAWAHEGPSFPLLSEERVGPYKVSVWSDPDIGTGTFFVILEPAKGKALTPPEGVRIGVAPVSGRLDEVIYAAEAQQVRYAARYYAEVAFDRHEWWKVRILLDGGELVTRVEATPVGLIVYLLPFLAVGFLWWKAALRRRSGR